MSITLVDIESAYEELGTSFRSRRRGPELDLLDWFLEQEYLRIPKGCRATVFREPRIDTGFPDLVIVIWSERRSRHWNPMRMELHNEDFRLMHYLAQAGHSTFPELRTRFQRRISASIERLMASELVRLSGDRLTPSNLSSTFSATRIIAIEAKVDERRHVLEQAFLNTWFASHSYILLPHPPKRDDLLKSAAALGVGVLSKEDLTLRGTESRSPGRLPLSYTSWLFNEWAWRAARLEEGTRC